jgi:ubiquinone/menaquinone biosynthesis C-methylase UbiE
MNALYVLALVVAAAVGGSLWRRRSSRGRPMPCPALLAWWLDNPLSSRLLGTQTTLDRIGLRPGQRVLEVGPGPGRLLIPAAKRVLPGGAVVGLDIQPGMLERLNARGAQQGVSNLTTVLGDAAEAHFPPDSFDVVYMCTVLGEIPEREAALRQCYAALKDGGVLSITEIFPDPHYQSRDRVRKLAESAGFRLREQLGPWYFFTANFVKAE